MVWIAQTNPLWGDSSHKKGKVVPKRATKKAATQSALSKNPPAPRHAPVSGLLLDVFCKTKRFWATRWEDFMLFGAHPEHGASRWWPEAPAKSRMVDWIYELWAERLRNMAPVCSSRGSGEGASFSSAACGKVLLLECGKGVLRKRDNSRPTR